MKIVQVNDSTGQRTSYKERIALLEDLAKTIREHEEEVFKALSLDLRKPRTEALLTEIAPVMQEIALIKKHLKSWMRPISVKRPASLWGTKNWMQYEAKGHVLILSPWNYPYRLAMNPLVAALAAGNRVSLKASEHSPNTSAIIYKIIRQSKASQYVKCYEGDSETAKKLLDSSFDHIFFTGSTATGKEVMRKAVEHLTPVTLELGGKSPCIVTSDVDLQMTCERILWGKFMNAGQTCVAPDYVLIHKDKADDFVEATKAVLKKFYSEDPAHSMSYARIIHQGHTRRIASVIEEERPRVVYGGTYDIESNYVSPTIILNPNIKSKLMQEEIFGPVLPILTYQSLEEVTSLINSMEKPLALYMFTNNKQSFDDVTQATSSGAAVMNSVASHLANPYLPFGGIGASGMGRYHGKFGFEELSHLRAYQAVPKVSALKLLFPPYDKLEKSLETWKEVLYKL